MEILNTLLKIKGVYYILNVTEKGIGVVNEEGKISHIKNEDINPVCIKDFYEEKDWRLDEFHHLYYAPNKGIYCFSKSINNIGRLKKMIEDMTGKELLLG